MAKKLKSGMYVLRNKDTKEVEGIKWIFDSEDEAGNQLYDVKTKEELGDECFSMLLEEAREEANLERKIRYHETVSLDDEELYEGMWMADNRTPDYFFNIEEENENVKEFFKLLTDNQKEKLQVKLANPEMSLRDIAKVFNISYESVRDVFDAIKKKAKKFFNPNTPQTI